MFRMTLRLLWWIFGPFGAVIDLLYMPGDDHRQTIRDKLLGTYVIRKDARPAGCGREEFGRLGFLGYMLLYPFVRPVDDAG